MPKHTQCVHPCSVVRMKPGTDDLLIHGSALAASAVAAPALTSLLVTIPVEFESILWIREMRVEDDGLKSILGYNYEHELGRWWAELPLNMIFAPIWGILFGFVGALLFLLVAFKLARRMKPQSPSYPIAGALAGIVHSLLGYCLATIHSYVPPSLTEDALSWILLVGGFALTSEREIVVISTFVAAPTAGYVVGRMYVRMIGGLSGPT